MMIPPRPVQPGEEIRAKDVNRIVRGVAPVTDPSGGLGVLRSSNPRSSGFGLARIDRRRFEIPALITAVHYVDGNSSNLLVENVNYSAVAIGAPTEVVPNEPPKYGRLFASGVQVQPCEVGDYCYIIRLPDGEGGSTADIEVMSEQVLTHRCTSGTGAGGAALLPEGFMGPLTPITPGGPPATPGNFPAPPAEP